MTCKVSLISVSRLCVSLGLALALIACGKKEETAPAPQAAAAASGQSDWNAFRDEYLEAYFKAHPAFAVGAGRHEYDGQLPDWRAEAITAEIKRLHEARDRAAAFKDEQLDEGHRFERDYLVAVIDRDLFWMETADMPHSNPMYYGGQGGIDGLDPSAYLTREYAPLEQRMKAYIGYARSIPRVAGEIRQNLRMPMAKPLLERGIAFFGGFAEFYAKEVDPIFKDVKDEALHKELSEVDTAAASAMKDLADWLKSNLAAATQDYALGPDKFAKMLYATERVNTPIDELENVGRADLERNQAALKEACAKYAPGVSIPKCMGKVGDDKPKGGPVQGARDQLAGLRSFIAEKSVVTIPGTEQALVAEAPPYNRGNFAYIDIPGPYEKGLASTYYISPPDPAWSAKVQHDYLPGKADLLFTSVHEVWPGHFLQFLHSNRSASKVGSLFVGYAFAEGWAHYGEEMMWEMGVGNGDPETHIGQLSNALLRNCRYLSAIGLHTKGMSVADSEKMFREQCYQDEGNAKQQAARGTYDPAYLNYTMGKLMIRKLRADWTASRGGQAAWHDFHDQFLSHGGPPIPMARAVMMGNADGPLF